MTEIYDPLVDEGFELCHPERNNDFETLRVQINGMPRRVTWRPIRMQLIREDEGKKLMVSDSPWLGSHALIFRKPAIEKLAGLLEEYGELLPLTCSEAELFVFNPTRVLDALDEQASSVMRFSNGRIMRITRYVFKPAIVAGSHIFKIANLRVSPTFVDEHVVKAWASAGLRGLAFDKVWSC